ncbi:MAG: protein kinase [Pyrinomonadaceae bacterium]
MNSKEWKEVKEVLEAALDLRAAERSRYLDLRCGGNIALRAEVDSLLRADDTRANLFESDVASTIFATEAGSSLIGDRVGPYKIIDELGRGGMGTVFLARRVDGAFDQTVALKLIKRGMDSGAILKRFVNERQILASLDHPNIAHLIDGGTTDDGQPYFVMEHVEGEAIDLHARRAGVSLSERLHLFREVCSAVSFAHQNLVIHRDLKPSNILIAKDGQVKLLDFGIARLLKTEDDLQTATQNFVFTPEYASPEQVRGDPLTTATDIYSLGVILYELLSGNKPYQTGGKSISEIIKAVCETEPERPSSVVSRLSRVSQNSTAANKDQKTYDQWPNTRQQSPVSIPRLKGDLDNIILKALRKEPERRYTSVEQFADDIRRHVAGLPVTASPDTWGYRATKFIRRNRVGVAAATIIFVTLFAGLFATLYQRNKAQRRFNDVRQLANSFLFEFHDSIRDLPGATPARELVVKRALEYLDQLSQESEGDIALKRELATAYAQIGQIQGNSYHSNLGDSEGAMKSYLLSLQIRQALVDADPSNRDLRHELADSYEGVGDMHYTIDELPLGLESYENAVAIRDKIVAEDPTNLEYRYSLAGVLGKRGDISGMEGFPNLGDLPRALDSYQRGIAVYQECLKADPDNEKYKLGYATSLNFHGMLQNSVGDTNGAIESGRRSLEIFDSLTTANPNNAKYEQHKMAALNFMRYPLVDEQLFGEALKNAQRVIETMEKQSAADPKNAFNRRSLGVSYNALGRIRTEMNEGSMAIEYHQKALRIAEDLLAADPESSENRRDVAMTHEFLADSQASKGDHAAAIQNYRRALELYGVSSGEDLATAYLGLSKSLAATGKLQDAIDSFRQTVVSVEEAALKAPQNAKKQSRLAIYYLEGGKILGRLAAADNHNPSLLREARQWLDNSSNIFRTLATSGKLAKLYSKYPPEVAAEIKRLN